MSNKITVHLHGKLRKHYNKSYELYVDNVVQACLLLSAQLKGFREEIKKGKFRVVIGDKKDGMVIKKDELYFHVSKEVHIIPIVKGSSGLGEVLAGVALITLAVLQPELLVTALWSGAPAVITNIGVGLVLGGAAMMLAPQLGANYNSRQATAQSFIFNGAVNTSGQGMPVPLVYGRHMAGAAVISSVLNIDSSAPIYHGL